MAHVIKGDGSRWWMLKGGKLVPYRGWRRALHGIHGWWSSRDWRRRQGEFKRTGTRYYGDGGTIHNTSALDIETRDGMIFAVWFRCQPLPFRVTLCSEERAIEMQRMYKSNAGLTLHGVEVRDPKGNN